MRKLIKELADEEQGSSVGPNRNLVPSLLERFPSVDRPKIGFPPELVDFFLDIEEKVVTAKEKEMMIAKRLKKLDQGEGQYYQ